MSSSLKLQYSEDSSQWKPKAHLRGSFQEWSPDTNLNATRSHKSKTLLKTFYSNAFVVKTLKKEYPGDSYWKLLGFLYIFVGGGQFFQNGVVFKNKVRGKNHKEVEKFFKVQVKWDFKNLEKDGRNWSAIHGNKTECEGGKHRWSHWFFAVFTASL